MYQFSQVGNFVVNLSINRVFVLNLILSDLPALYRFTEKTEKVKHVINGIIKQILLLLLWGMLGCFVSVEWYYFEIQMTY